LRQSSVTTPTAHFSARPKPLLIASVGRALGNSPLGRRGDDVELRRVPAFPAPGTLDPDRPTVILLDRQMIQTLERDRERLSEAAKIAAIVGLGDTEKDEPPPDLADLMVSYIPAGATPGTFMTLLRGGFRHAATLLAERSAKGQERQRHRELAELSKIGVALSTERNLLTLLEMILSQARRITNSDAGSLYLVERDENDVPKSLRFKLTQNFSLPNLPLMEFSVPIDNSSMAGYAAHTGEALMIGDVYLLPEDVSYKQNRSFDEKFGYRSKSMLVIPMRSHRDEVVGVLQLLNRKRSSDVMLSSPEVTDREVISYDQATVEIISALASQAAVSIENSMLYEDIEKLFEGFVTAAVTAIESRDPTTFGHSGRVASLSVGLAEAVDRGGEGQYRGTRFSREQLKELRYAGLLHDFGKVGVREQVLVKQKKLYPYDLEVIKHRFAYLKQAAELEFERTRSQFLMTHGREKYTQVELELERARAQRREELEHFMSAIIAANEPTILAEDSSNELKLLAQKTWVDLDGAERPLLSADELRFLQIPRGNLDDRERREIESHVSHTFRFLQQIPWTRDLRGVPEIAFGHHEKLNGRGYPRAVQAEAIPVQTRMMTISDIYDALTASDRPYKRAVSTDRALDILHMEAKEGMLDTELLKIFVQARVFELVARPSGEYRTIKP
jgi:HD-GYP domain-containing protein (c-di-GMP phosphodiesterase class II)